MESTALRKKILLILAKPLMFTRGKAYIIVEVLMSKLFFVAALSLFCQSSLAMDRFSEAIPDQEIILELLNFFGPQVEETIFNMNLDWPQILTQLNNQIAEFPEAIKEIKKVVEDGLLKQSSTSKYLLGGSLALVAFPSAYFLLNKYLYQDNQENDNGQDS